MSAPGELDRRAARRTTAVLPRQRALHLVGSERRSPDPVAVLSRDHEALCRNATDPLEVAAGLEAAGLSDRLVRAEYGLATVFDLAERLWVDVPRRPSPPERPSPWLRPRRELWARGLVFALPGLLVVGAVRHLRGPEVVLLLAASVLAAGANQGLAHLGHLLLGRDARAEARRLLRAAVPVSATVAVILVLPSLLSGTVGAAAALLVLLVATYLTGATVVLLLGRHLLLLRVLLPGVVLAVLDVLGVTWVARLESAAAVAGVLGCALTARVLSGRLTGPPRPDRDLTAADLRGALPLVAHGLASMALLSLVPLTALRSGGVGAVGPVMLPAVLSLGAAEVHLYGFRACADVLLRRTHVLAFAAAVRLELVRRTVSYLAVLLGLTAVVLLVAPRPPGGDPRYGRHLATYALLALALFAASLLLSTGHAGLVAGAEAAALALDLVLQQLPGGVEASLAHLVAASGLALVTVVLAGTRLGRLVSYR